MGEMIPLFGMLFGALITVAAIWGAVRVAHGPLGQALARRLQGRGGDTELSGEVAELRDQLEMLRHQLEETQERVDFAERLLSRQPSPTRIAAGDEKA